jgi:dTDP-4-dehydrorhamnose reductase/UDP-glucose 4-epimerase
MTRDGAKKTSVLLVGASSLLGKALLAESQDAVSITGVSHTAFETVDPGAYDVVINMAYDPRYMRDAYETNIDFDRKVAEATARSGAHFVMLSTRRVYGPNQAIPVSEDALAQPVDAYGRNKLRTEGEIRALLGERCTILRLANVFGFEPGRHTFLGIALNNLRRTGRIVLDANPFVKKDFLPLPDCAAALLSVLALKPGGTFNLGYGTATETGRIAMWLIEGFGRGELVVSSAGERDSFLLDSSRLKALVALPEPRTSIRAYCVKIGEQLRDA